MPEASTRILIDRTVLCLDGRPFFTYGVRLFLTPAELIPGALEDIRGAGFNTIISPPASPGVLPLLNKLFDEAEARDLMVVLMTDPRVPEPSAFLARHFRHRRGLHSYCLMVPDASAQSLAWFIQERDRLRAHDLFHPIWTPLRSEETLALWLESTDLQAVDQILGGPFPRREHEDGRAKVTRILAECALRKMPGRPFFCSRLQASVPDEARRAGLYDSDPSIRRNSPSAEEWFPWLANLGESGRADFLAPDPDLVRVRAIEMLASRVRGLMVDYYEFLLGTPPMTGRDRFCELAVLSHEIAACEGFFSSGIQVRAELETGHPRLRGSMIRHEEDLLLLLWRSAQGDEFWIDPSRMHRVEVGVQLDADPAWKAWRLDFPAVKPVSLVRDERGTVRLGIQSVDLSAKILLTRNDDVAEGAARAVEERLPRAAAWMIQGLDHRLDKLAFIERELASLASGRRQEGLLSSCRRQAEDARALIESGDCANAWDLMTEAQQSIRTLINNQMIAALGASQQADHESFLGLLRHSYYTLPEYYRQTMERDEQLIQEYT